MKKSDVEKYDLKGMVKSVLQSSFEAVGKLEDVKLGVQLNSFPHSKTSTFFNEGGKITEEIRYIDGSLLSKYIFTYDETGKLIKDESFHDDNTERSRTNYKYDEQGKLIEEIHYARILKEYYRLSFKHKKNFLYDENGNLIEETFSNGNSYFDKKITYRYDASGNRTDQLDLGGDNILRDRSMFKYDRNGNKIEFAYLDVGGTLTTFIYKYDENGNLIEEGIKGSSNKKSYAYDYDSQGNWIKKVQFSSNIDTSIVLRQIEYWK